MASNKAVKVDPKDLRNAEKMWHNFTVLGKYSILGTCLLLVLLALAFVQF
ncbi:MAG: aa3-type cytochrome c oxidase subunit IV [Alphaproteobacteria bacterium]